jgi:GGDEF domain-containing protein
VALDRPSGALIADLAGRLSTVAATVTEAVLDATATATAPSAPDRAPLAPTAAPSAPTAAPSAADPAPSPTSASAAPSHPFWPAAGQASTPSSPVVWTPTAPPRPLHEAPPPDDGLLSTPLASVPSAFSARDLRPRITAGDPLAHLAERVSHHLTDQRTLAVLLVELDGIDRLMTAGDDAMEAIARAELAIEGLLRPGDGARRESAGRIWISLPGTGPAGARALALRISVAVERAATHRGIPLAVAIGVAVFPSDATDAPGLVDQAEEALFAARASGHRGPQPA